MKRLFLLDSMCLGNLELFSMFTRTCHCGVKHFIDGLWIWHWHCVAHLVIHISMWNNDILLDSKWKLYHSGAYEENKPMVWQCLNTACMPLLWFLTHLQKLCTECYTCTAFSQWTIFHWLHQFMWVHVFNLTTIVWAVCVRCKLHFGFCERST